MTCTLTRGPDCRFEVGSLLPPERKNHRITATFGYQCVLGGVVPALAWAELWLNKRWVLWERYSPRECSQPSGIDQGADPGFNTSRAAASALGSFLLSLGLLKTMQQTLVCAYPTLACESSVLVSPAEARYSQRTPRGGPEFDFSPRVFFFFF